MLDACGEAVISAFLPLVSSGPRRPTGSTCKAVISDCCGSANRRNVGAMMVWALERRRVRRDSQALGASDTHFHQFDLHFHPPSPFRSIPANIAELALVMASLTGSSCSRE